MKIKVARKHIRKGIPISPHSCPVALAIQDVFDVGYINVSSSYINIGESYWEFLRWETPKQVKEFISKFDKTSSYLYRLFFIKPFEFELDVAQY